MVGTLQPLDQKFAIVDKYGNPTDYFTRWAQQKQIDINGSIALSDLVSYLAAHKITAGQGIGLTPDGNLSDSPSIAVLNGTGLNFDAMHNLKLADTAVVPGTYGDATHVPAIVVDQQGRITGITLVPISGGGGGPVSEESFTKPTLSNFSITRAGTGVIENIWSGVRIRAPGTSTNTNNLLYGIQAITAGVNGWRLTLRLKRHFPFLQWAGTGIILRNSGSGSSRLYWSGNDATIGFNRNTYTSDTSWASVTALLTAQEYGLDWWMRVVDDLTKHYIYVSKDGQYWQLIYSEARTTFITPDQVGIFMNPNCGGSTVGSANGIRTEVAFDCLSYLFEQL